MILMSSVISTVVALISTVGLPVGAASQAVDTIRVGSGSLSAARPELGTTRVESFVREQGTDTPPSVTTQRISAGVWGEIDVFAVETEHVGDEGDTTMSTLVVRASDLSLLHHRVKAEHDSAAVSSNEGSLTGWAVLPGEPARLVDLSPGRSVFPIAGQIPWLFPLLPLSEGYAAAIPHFSQWAGREEWSTIRVVGSDRIDHHGEPRECWRVDGGELFPGFRVTYWVEKANRRILLGVARSEEGDPEYWSRLIRFEPDK